MTLTAAHARELMGDAMDARALNHQQAQALVNDTPEVDSIAEHIAALVAQGLVKPSRAKDLWQLTMRVFELNQTEGGLEMSLCGSLDDIATRLWDAETNHAADMWTVKSLGRELRWALPVVFDPASHAVARVVAAGALVDRVLAEVPAAQLFTNSVRKELRDTNYGRLLELHAARNQQEGEVAA